MLASWMVYVSLVSLAFTIAALALERVASARRWPLRWIWAGALTASIAWPVASTLWRATPPRAAADVSPAVLPLTIVVGPDASVAAEPDRLARAALLDRGLIIGWGVLSALMMLRLSYSLMTLRRRRRTWRRASVDGVPLHVSANDGPAVVGFSSMSVVLPAWTLSLDESLRALILSHENEHRAAKDPYLLLAATIAIALFPWNVALWMLDRRLRLAIEMDCDARVLRAHPTPERYGLLMITVAQRRSRAPARFAAMLSEPTTHLERRIVAMHTTRRMTRLTACAVATGALALVATACSLRSGGASVSGFNDPAFAAWMNKQGFRSWTTASPALGNSAPRYPDQLLQQRVEGAVLVAVVIDTSGTPDMRAFRVLESTDPRFTESVRTSLRAMHFVAAQVDGRKVKQLVQVPFVFSVGGAAGEVAAAALDSAHRTTNCDQSAACPILRLARVVSTAKP